MRNPRPLWHTFSLAVALFIPLVFILQLWNQTRTAEFQREVNEDSIPESLLTRGDTVFRLDVESLLADPVRFTPAFRLPLAGYDTMSEAWIRAEGKFFFTCQPADNKVLLVITGNHLGKAFAYRSTPLSDAGFTPGRWNKVSLTCRIPEPVDSSGVLEVYFWNFGEQTCAVDDMKVVLYKSTVIR